MSKYILLPVLFLIAAISSHAQDDSRYLAGAVPELDGKIIFTRTITPDKNISDDQLFTLMDKWAKDNYKSQTPKNRVLLSTPKTHTIACSGEAEIVFKRAALSLDQTVMTYQLTMKIEDGKCNTAIRGIKFEYNNTGKGDEIIPAEEMISDEYSLNKDKTKLNRYYSKFRTRTVDYVDELFDSMEVYLNGKKGSEGALSAATAPANQPEATPIVVPSTPTREPVSAPIALSGTITTEQGGDVSLPGYRKIAPDRIPGNIIKLLGDWTLITSGTDTKTNVMTASWGGLGVFWEKPISICFLNPTRYSVTTMDEGETYTISFYTEAYKDALTYCGTTSGRNTDKIKGSGLTPIKTPSGATAFAEAWMIFECKKILAQPISADAVKADDLPTGYTVDGYHKIYMGEILNVWIK